MSRPSTSIEDSGAEGDMNFADPSLEVSEEKNTVSDVETIFL